MRYKVMVEVEVYAFHPEDAQETVRKMMIEHLVKKFTTTPPRGLSGMVDFEIWSANKVRDEKRA